MLQELKEKISQLSNKISFDTPVVVKTSPHTYPVRIYEVELSNEKVYANCSGDWFEVEEKDTLVIPSIMQRILITINNK